MMQMMETERDRRNKTPQVMSPRLPKTSQSIPNFQHNKYIYIYISGWLLKNHLKKYEFVNGNLKKLWVRQWEGWHPIYYEKIKNVPNHQPVCIYIYWGLFFIPLRLFPFRSSCASPLRALARPAFQSLLRFWKVFFYEHSFTKIQALKKLTWNQVGKNRMWSLRWWAGRCFEVVQ